jgi:hypothetical protein
MEPLTRGALTYLWANRVLGAWLMKSQHVNLHPVMYQLFAAKLYHLFAAKLYHLFAAKMHHHPVEVKLLS